VSTAADTDVLRDCVAGYAARLHAAAGQGQHVVSPLGAWLLLALCGTGPGEQGRAALGEVLGCDAGTAARLAAGLLARPHPQVATAAAVWASPLPAHLQAWQAGLPAAVATGPVPAPAAADAWARDHTFGLIEKFPLDLSGADLALATALACRVPWEQPFDLAPAASLGAGSPWAGLGQVLATPRQPDGHDQFVAATTRAGDVIVHLASARGGLLVASVGAAPGVPAADVLAAAHEIGPAAVTGTAVTGTAIDHRPVASLPLGEGPLWQVTEVAGPGADSCTAVLPAWSARTTLPLTDPSLGVGAAVAALDAPGRWAAAQAAMARYTRTGFEAAAVTAMAREMAMIRPPGGRHRVARLRFGHPYAVVAVAVDEGGPWHGVPVFSAWVADPQDASAR
jgi:hypothetical protein